MKTAPLKSAEAKDPADKLFCSILSYNLHPFMYEIHGTKNWSKISFNLGMHAV